MADKDGVIQSGTPAGTDQEIPSRSGDNHVLPDGRNVREVLEENKRKSEELKTLKAEKEEVEERLAELESKGRLTPEEKQEKKDLQGQGNDLKALIRKAKEDPENQVLIELIRELSEETAEKRLSQRELNKSFDKQESFLEEKAKAEGVTAKELRKKLNAYAGPYQHEPPHLQAEHAYRDLKRFSEIEAKEQKLKEREKQEQDYVEGGSPSGSGLVPSKRRFSPDMTGDEALASLASM